MYLIINKWVIAVNVSKFSGQYLRNNWTLDIGVLGYIGIVWPKEHSPEVWSVPPVIPCIVFLGRTADMRTSFSRLAGFLLWLQNWGLANVLLFSSTVKWISQKVQQALYCALSAYSFPLFYCLAKYIKWQFEVSSGLRAVSHVLLTLLYITYKKM